MKTKWRLATWGGLVLAAVLPGIDRLSAQAPELPAGGAWRYQLIEGSTLTDDSAAGRPSITLPMRGTFTLRLQGEDPLYRHYVLEDIAFTAGSVPGSLYKVTGTGAYALGGEVAVRQDLVLNVSVDTGAARVAAVLTNTTFTPPRPWPMVVADTGQSNKTLVQFFWMQVVAAPLQDVWFSTTGGLTPGNWQPPTNHVSAGDLISLSGGVVRRNETLTGRLGIMPLVPDLGLDATDLQPGGEVAFSIESEVFSETLGPLKAGDLLSDQGVVLRRFADLVAAFVPQPPVADAGLDAVQVQADGEVLFSMGTNLFSEQLGVVLERGDLLSRSGKIVRRNADLLARFHPPDPKKDYGLDALYVWPSGEIWFSTEEGFQDQQLGAVLDGDLLTDQGAVVLRNLELVGVFAPLEDVSQFGLDALYVVTDCTPPADAPRIVSLKPEGGGWTIACDGSGRAFQLEQAPTAQGPWTPASPILPDRVWVEPPSGPGSAAVFYRVRQW